MYVRLNPKNMNNEVTYEIKYHPNGNIHRRIPYKEGRIDGLEEWFFEDGSIQCKTTWKEGKPDGLEEWFWENGNVRGRTPYKAGLFHGQEMFYDEQGNITETYLWEDGELIEEN
ncbi:hypothetical protein EB118_19060 [bacterium]|nr:hypothetical protein [bacterium]